MRKLTLVSATAIGLVIGATGFCASPAYADWPVFDVAVAAAVNAVKDGVSVVKDTVTMVNTTLGNLLSATGPLGSILGDTQYGTVTELLRDGFTQMANYSKAQIGALQQIFDASNTAMARFHRDVRNAEIRDEHTTSPTHCAAIDSGQTVQAASVQAYAVGGAITRIQDLRGQAGPGMPSYQGLAQGAASMTSAHLNAYCDQNDVDAGICPALSATPDADQEAQSLFGGGTYANQAAINAAKDYAVHLIEPVAPAPLRGDMLTSASGSYAAVLRRSYNARMSLARTFVAQAIGMQTPSVPLTAVQQQYLQGMGLPAQTTSSWLQTLQIEAERRVSDLTWHANLQQMPPASVEREVAIELALTNFLLFQNFKLGLQQGSLTAATLAEQTEQGFREIGRLPTPSIASN